MCFTRKAFILEGGEKYLFELFKRVSKTYNVIIYFESISPAWRKLYEDIGIEIRHFWKPKRFYWLLLPFTLLVNAVMLKQHIHKTDIIYATNFPVNLLAMLLSKRTICHCFEPLAIFYDPIRINSLPLFSRICVSVAKFLYATADHYAINHSTVLTTLNVSVEKHIIHTYGRRPDTYIPNGVDASVFKPKKTKRKSQICIMGHSTDYTVFKGTSNLLAALNIVKNKTNNFQVLISESITDASVRRRYLQYIKQHNLRKYIRFIGNLTEKQLVRFYQSIDVFCYAGSPDCAGGSTASLSVVEAQACGTPVIRSTGNDDEIIHNKTGYYVNPNDPVAFAHKIIKFIKLSKASKSRLRHTSVQHVKKHFQWSVSSSRLVHIVKSLELTR